MKEKYNSWEGKPIEIILGEEICPECGGRGIINMDVPKKENYMLDWGKCQKCRGKGKVDWISKVIGEV